MAEYILYLVASFLAVVVILTTHEAAHSFVAYCCGDPTPKWNGRLSLNPLRHFDPIGLVCFAVVGFGWARPVPINPNNFKKYRTGLFLTSVAGIAVNFLTAFIIYPVYLAVLYYGGVMPNFFYLLFRDFFQCMFMYGLSFCVFNLLPFYPLDGFRIVDALNRRRGKVYRFLRANGYYILLGLIVESFICNLFVRMGVYQMSYFNVLGWFMTFATDILGWPIKALWGLIPW